VGKSGELLCRTGTIAASESVGVVGTKKGGKYDPSIGVHKW
jgi:hypothetical protein